MLCLSCKKEFKAIRISAKYCSAFCRKQHFIKEVSVPDNSIVSVPKVSVPLKNKVSVLDPSRCHGCNEEQPQVEGKYLVCICWKCIAKNITHKSLGINQEACL